ncbi:MAG: hypothetical protein IKR81_10465, partial [Victivallales bacterium]|nr:hypothetical protein [Victivallales bacterium]
MKRLFAVLVLLAAVSAYSLDSQARWIWRKGTAMDGEVLYMRHVLTLDAVPDGGFIHVVGDDNETFYLNGEMQFSNGFGTRKVDIKKLKAGENTLASRIRNDTACAGLLVYGELQVGGKTVIVKTDKSWKVRRSVMITDGWEKPGFDDSNWENAVELRGVTDQFVWRNLIKVGDFLTKEEFQIEEAERIRVQTLIDGDLAALRAKLAMETKPMKAEFVRRNNVPFIS